MSLGAWFEFGYSAAGGCQSKDGGICSKEVMQQFARADCDSRASSEEAKRHDGARCLHAPELIEGGDHDTAAAHRRQRAEDGEDLFFDHSNVHALRDTRVIRPRAAPCASFSCSILGSIPKLLLDNHHQHHHVDPFLRNIVTTDGSSSCGSSSLAADSSCQHSSIRTSNQQQLSSSDSFLHFSERAGHCAAALSSNVGVVFGGFRCVGRGLELMHGVDLIIRSRQGALSHRHLPADATAPADPSSAPCPRFGACLVSPRLALNDDNETASAIFNASSSSSSLFASAIMIGGTTDCATYQLGTEPVFRSALNDIYLLSSSSSGVQWTRAALLDSFPAHCFGQAVIVSDSRSASSPAGNGNGNGAFASLSLELLHFGGFLPSVAEINNNNNNNNNNAAEQNADNDDDDAAHDLAPRVSGELRTLTVSWLREGEQPTVHSRPLQNCFGTAPTPRGGHSMVALSAAAAHSNSVGAVMVFGGFGIVADRVEGESCAQKATSKQQQQQQPAATTHISFTEAADGNVLALNFVSGGDASKQREQQQQQLENDDSLNNNQLDYGDLLGDDDDYDLGMFADDEGDDGATHDVEEKQQQQQQQDELFVDPVAHDPTSSASSSENTQHHQLARLSDCYILDLSSSVWRRVDTSCSPHLRTPRCFATLLPLGDRRRFLLLGGETDGGRPAFSALRIDIFGAGNRAAKFSKQCVFGLDQQCFANRHGAMGAFVTFPPAAVHDSSQQEQSVLIGGAGWKDEGQRLWVMSHRDRRHDAASDHQLTCLSSSVSGSGGGGATLRDLASTWLCAADLSLAQ